MKMDLTEDEMAGLYDKFPILKFFVYSHLPERLQKVSKPFAELACNMAYAGEYTNLIETEVGLRKLLEAKDCFVRAAL
jgi:hypothetical protein